MTDRRSFLGILGMAPLAAKSAAEEVIMGNTMTSSDMGKIQTAFIQGAIDKNVSPVAPIGNYFSYEEILVKSSDYINQFGVPEIIAHDMRERTRHVSYLDPDIACKATWSTSVKMMTQRQRNFDREIEALKNRGWLTRKREALTKLLGFVFHY